MLNHEVSISFNIIPPTENQDLLERISTMADEIPLEELNLPPTYYPPELCVYWSLLPPFNADQPEIAISVVPADEDGSAFSGNNLL